ncbi:hypothetical protein PIB30_104995 [Stylosanthes scabra]|uniref:Uncharacterized protein n=1 Tax=Stylosanthes scabra TaxID=79078 RepID=A0ABU6X049_9FABA|nr:hypothetical protein [Stylosanthes scabra]
MPTKGNKGGRPQVLLGRPFLKTTEFKLIYYDEIFTFSVGNIIEIFHLKPLPKPPKKRIQQLQLGNAKVRKESPGRKAKIQKNQEGGSAMKKGRGMLPLNPKKEEVPILSIEYDHFRWLAKHLPLWPRERLRFTSYLPRFSLRLAALRACQPINKVGPSVSTPSVPDPIIISSDYEEDLYPKGSSSEEKDPEMDPEGEDQGVNLLDESEEDPEMDPDHDIEDEEMEEEAEQDSNDDEDFVDYVELAPPASPDSSDESFPPIDD